MDVLAPLSVENSHLLHPATNAVGINKGNLIQCAHHYAVQYTAPGSIVGQTSVLEQREVLLGFGLLPRRPRVEHFATHLEHALKVLVGEIGLAGS